jgi:tRNA-binding EMAP/Myf-like protein
MPRTHAFILSVATVLVAGSATLSADRVKLRSGQPVDGSLMSADAKIVRLLLANGQIAEFDVADISALEFTPRKAPPPPPPDPAKAPATSLTIPNGTVLSVMLTQGIEADSAQAGMTYKALLDDPVMMNGKVVIPRNSAVEVQIAKVENAGKMKGADKITLKANSISFGGKKYDIVTAYNETKGQGEGKKTTRKIGGGAGIGAAIGGIAGGGKGAAIGALAGAGTGAVMAASGTEKLKLPAESRVQFTLSAAVTVQL